MVNSILLDCRTDCNSVDNRGRTALWWAVYTGKTAIMEQLLVDDGVLSNVADDKGIDALNAARQQNYFGIVSLL